MKKALLVLALMVLSAGSIIAVPNFVAKAQSSQCSAKANLGYKCYQERAIRARSGYPGSDTGSFTYSPPPGYIIMDYKEVVQSRFGEGGNVNINFVRGGTFAKLQSSIDSFNRTLIDQKARMESYARFPISGVPITVGGETEAIEKALRENSSRLQMLSSDYSNVDRVQASVTVRGRCTRYALGVCVDNQGGKYEGYIRFSLEYVGTPQDIIAANEAAIKRAQNSLALLEQAQKNGSGNNNQVSNGKFIANSLSGKCIDVAGAPGNTSSARLQLWDCETSGRNRDNGSETDQRWTITNEGFIKNTLSGKCIDVAGAPGNTNSAPLILWDCEISGRNNENGSPTDQKWRLQ